MDLFVSYAGPDRPWAEWAAWHLEQAGYQVELDVWDWAAGDNAVLRMTDALARADRMLALFSRAYFQRDRFTTDEWTAVMAERPAADGGRRLVPVRVEETKPPAILGPLIYRDLFGLAEVRARDELLTAVGGPRRPGTQPPYPDGRPTGPRVAGSLPPVCNLPARNPAFAGRQALLATLRERLAGGNGRAWVQALRGQGGVGKTQLAIEYGHLFAGDYQLIWWVDAERAELVGEQLAALAFKAGWATPDTATTEAVRVVADRLRGESGWLLVFDNAENPADLRPLLPQGPGQVVITSRAGGFGQIAQPVDVDVLPRPESIALLRVQVPTLAELDADRLASALGDLPLALTQAAGLLSGTGMTVDEYLSELSTHVTELLSESAPVDYPVPLAAAITLSVDQLATVDEAAVQLLHACATLAPDPIPLAWLRNAPEVLSDPLATTIGSTLAFRHTLGRLADRGLARVTGDTIQLHRLTQAVLRDRRTEAESQADRERAERLLTAAGPDDSGVDPASWPAWADRLPHLLFLDPATAGRDLRSTASNALWYLLMRGEYHTLLAHARAWYEHWRATHGPDDRDTLAAANQLATAYLYLGDPQRARELDEDSLARRRRLHGDDHPGTLTSASNLANALGALGELESARDLHQDTLTRRRRVRGPDHPETLSSANNLAIVLHSLGEYEPARDLHRDTLARYRRVLGPDHPETLSSANNLAVALRTLGEYEQARDLHRDALTRRRRILGPDHPKTRKSARYLAGILRELGEHERAGEIEAEYGLAGTQ
jgi:tetratricopeptide (TPR) repeat protein